MANKLSLTLFIVLLELSALHAQSWWRGPLWRQNSPLTRRFRVGIPPRPVTFWRPELGSAQFPRRFPRFREPFRFGQFNRRNFPFGARPIPPPNFRFQGNRQNGFNPFFQNQIPPFQNRITNNFNQQTDTNNDPPPVMVTGTVDPRRIANVASRFQLPTGRQLFWQMSSPPEEETNTFANTGGVTNTRTTGIQNTLPGTQNTLPGMQNTVQGLPNTVPILQNGFDRTGMFSQPVNRINGNNVLFQNRLNGNSVVPRAVPRTVQGLRRTQIANLNLQNQLTAANRVLPTATIPNIQEPMLVVNQPGIPNRNQLLMRNQQSQNMIRNQVLENQQRNSGSGVVDIRPIANVRVPTGQFTASPTVPPTQQSVVNQVGGASTSQANNAQREVMVPIFPGVPGLTEVPPEAVKSNSSMEYVEIITISDAEGNVYYQGLNSTDSDHRRINTILSEIEKNQTREAHRRGRAGLATLPDTGDNNPNQGSQTASTSGQGDSGGTGNITVMDENNNILYQGPELPEAELQARIRAKLEAQEREKLRLADQNSQNAASSSSSSDSGSTQTEVTPSTTSVSRDQNRLVQVEAPVGFNPLATGFDPNRLALSRGIPSQFNPSEERFALRQNSDRRTTDRQTPRRSDSTSLNIGVSNAINERVNNIRRSDSRMSLDNRISPLRNSPSTRERQNQSEVFVIRSQQTPSEDSSRPDFTVSRTVWTI